jgi:hypothetical protein
MVSTSWAADIIDFSGMWISTEQIDNSRCGGKVDTYREVYVIKQDKKKVHVESVRGEVFKATIENGVLILKGSLEREGGRTTFRAELVLDNGMLIGEAEWSWTHGEERCTGKTRISAERYKPDIRSDRIPNEGIH